MSDHTQKFIRHLQHIKERDRGALAILRRSLSFEPGAYPAAYPYVERYVPQDRHAQDSFRLALYVVAGLYASHPVQSEQSFAGSLGELLRKRESPSLEKRFVALLGADPENLADYLRQSVSLLASEAIGCDYAALTNDVAIWLDPRIDPDRRDAVRQRWARDFYRHAQPFSEPETANQDKDA